MKPLKEIIKIKKKPQGNNNIRRKSVKPPESNLMEITQRLLLILYVMLSVKNTAVGNIAYYYYYELCTSIRPGPSRFTLRKEIPVCLTRNTEFSAWSMKVTLFLLTVYRISQKIFPILLSLKKKKNR